MERLGRLALVTICALVSPATGGLAQASPSPTAAPSASPTPVAFTAHAHADVRVLAQGNTYNGTAQLALAQRGNLVRVDVLSIKSETIPLRPIAATIVIDRGANTVTGWSDTTRRYHVQPLIPRVLPSAAPKPTGTPRPAAAGTSPLANLDVFALSLTLTGHTTTAGIPTTGLAFDLQVRKRGETVASNVKATMQVADEFPAFPMTIDVSVEPGAAPFSAHAAYVVDDLERVAPAPGRFAIPAGYTEASTFAGVFFGRNGAPAPAASPHPNR